MIINLSSLIHDSIVDGEGIRSVIFTQGCPHNCPGCHNQKAIPFEGGTPLDTEVIIKDILQRNLKKVTFSGGEPFAQAQACYEIAKILRENNYNLWSYTGYNFELLLRHRDPYVRKFLEQLDILVDGRFILAKKSMQALFRGSSNQRIIDVQAALKENKVVLSKRFKDTQPPIPTANDIFI